MNEIFVQIRRSSGLNSVGVFGTISFTQNSSAAGLCSPIHPMSALPHFLHLFDDALGTFFQIENGALSASLSFGHLKFRIGFV